MVTRSQFSDIVARTRDPASVPKLVLFSKTPKTKPTTSAKPPTVTKKPSAKAASRLPQPPASFTKGIGGAASSTNGYQFVHEACYARTRGQARPTKGGGRTGAKKSTGRDVIGELLRETPAHYQHLTAQEIAPRPPVHLFGLEPKELPGWYDELVAKSRKLTETRVRNGKTFQCRQRISVTILGAAVASYPGPPDDNDERYQEFCRLTVEWARARYKNKLVGIYAHTDEPHGHLHILFANDGANVKPFMAGHYIAQRAKEVRESKSSLGVAYKAGAKWLQDQFHKFVAEPLGLLRKSAEPKPRLPYAKAKARKKLEERQAAEAAALEKRRRQIELREQRAAEWLKERIEADEMTKEQAIELFQGFGPDKPESAPRIF